MNLFNIREGLKAATDKIKGLWNKREDFNGYTTPTPQEAQQGGITGATWGDAIEKLKQWRQDQFGKINEYYTGQLGQPAINTELGAQDWGVNYEKVNPFIRDRVKQVEDTFKEQLNRIKTKMEDIVGIQKERAQELQQEEKTVKYDNLFTNALDQWEWIPKDDASVKKWYNDFRYIFENPESPYYNMGQEIKNKLEGGKSNETIGTAGKQLESRYGRA